MKFIFSLLILLNRTGSYAQTPGYSIRHFSTENGLSHNQVTAMAEDDKGMLWLGTGSGVNRFDGYEFTDLSRAASGSPRLLSAYVQEMYLLAGNRLFIRYLNNRELAHLYDISSGNVKAVSLSQGVKGSYAGSWVAAGRFYCLRADEHNIYVYTLNDDDSFRYLLRIRQDEKKPVHPGNFKHLSFIRLPGKTEHYLLLLPYTGLLKIDARGNVLKRISRKAVEPVYRDQIFPALYIEKDSSVLIHDNFSTGRAVYLQYDLQQDSLILKTLQQGQTALQLNTSFSSHLEKSRFLQWVTRYPEEAKNDGCLLISRFSEAVYLNKQQGFIRITPERKLFNAFLNTSGAPWEPGIQCRGITRVRGNRILVATEKYGLQLINPALNHSERLKLSISGYPGKDSLVFGRNLLSESDSIVWATEAWATDKGGTLTRIDIPLKRAQVFPCDYIINNGYRLKDGEIWVATEPELGLKVHLLAFRPGENLFRKIELINAPAQMKTDRPACFYESADGTVWYATENGLYAINRKSMRVEKGFFSKERKNKSEQWPFPVFYNLPVPHVMTLQESRGGWLCLGTNGGGLVLLNPVNGATYNFTTKNGLADDHVCSILTDGKEWWLGTWKGLSAFNPANLSFRNFYSTDGLPSNEFNRFSAYRSPDGWCWMGGQRGCIAFRPDQLLTEQQPVKLILSEVGYFDQRTHSFASRHTGFGIDPVFNIPAGNRRFYCKLGVSDLSGDESNSYEYQLVKKGEKPSAAWRSNGSNRMILFDYLPSGNYILYLRNQGSNKLVSSNMLTIELRVDNFFYNTWWFYGIILLLASAILYLLYRYKLNQAIRIERMRTRISSDLHDEVGSLLSGVALQMELLQLSADDKQKPVISRIAEISRSAMSRMRDVVWTIDTRNNHSGDLMEKMKEFAQEQLSPLGVEYHFDSGLPASGIPIRDEIKQHLYLIFKEFISNSIKHSGATEMRFHLSLKGRQLTLMLQDNGRGLQSDQPSATGQGIANMHMRTALLQGNLQLMTEKGFGIVITCPV